MDLSPSTSAFAEHLFKHIATADQGNLLISPVGILTMLSMLLAGSRGNTKQQLTSVMKLPPDTSPNAVSNYIAPIIDSYEMASSSQDRLVMRNMLLASKGRTCGTRGILLEYEDTLILKYKAEVERVNFRTKGGLIQRSVNIWANESTDGSIPVALESPPPPDTYLMLIDVIFFNYQWATAFQASGPGAFFANGRTSVSAPFMKLVAPLKYLLTSCKSDSQIQLMEIPYKNQFSMIIILPSVNSSLSRVLARESLNNLASILLKKGRPKNLELHMPKFKFNARSSLEKALEKLGAPNLFEKPVDLSGINGEHNLKVSSIEHVTGIEVDGKGEKAAAITARFRRNKVVTVNRPFAFFIYDTAHNLPLFIGKFVTP